VRLILSHANPEEELLTMRRHLASTCVITLGTGYLLTTLACTVNTVNNTGVPYDGGDTNTDAASTADTGTETDTGTIDAGADAADAAAPMGSLRVAHFSPDSAAVDVCLTPAGSDFNGQTPQLASILGQGVDGGADAGPVGLTFAQVTTYFAVDAGTYAVRLVAAGATDCSTSLADLASVTIGQDTYTTVAAVGEHTVQQTDQALKLVSFADDVTAPAGTANLRFINASPSLTSVDFGTGSIAGTNFAPLFTGVAFGLAGTAAGTDAGAVDANGYLASQPLAGATISAHVSTGTVDTATATNVTVGAATAATFALINGVTGGGAAQLLQCPDIDNPNVVLAACSIVSPH
jgi:hypothetical protein